MKYALYYVSTSAVLQWQDTDLYNYPDLTADFGRVEIPESFPDFDINNTVAGWWVVDGELTQTAPPVPLVQIAQTLQGEAFNRRANGIAAGITLADATAFAPTEADLSRIASVALGHSMLGITEIDIQLGTAWHHFTALDLEGAYGDLMRRREAFYSAESVHCAAIAALLAANDRPGLEAYDITTGWPA